MRTVAVTLAALVTALVVSLPSGAADARQVTPGHFTGFALDTCDAPSQHTMNRWLTHSKYWGVGVYIAGMNRGCDAQPHLTRRWVATQLAHGWRLLPLVVGRQASCSPKGWYRGRRISDDPHHDFARARGQGRDAAAAAVEAAGRLGIGRRSVLWFDLESFDVTRTRCRRSALAFVSGWTSGLHRHRYRSGFYSSASTGITLVDRARRRHPHRYDLPDYLWVAEWNGEPTIRSRYFSRQGWWPDRRVHQYRGPHYERHGRAWLYLDSNFMSTGRGSHPGKPARHCGVRVDFRSYVRLARGETGARVGAAQCLLHQRHLYRRAVNGRFGARTERAVAHFQRRRGLPVTGVLGEVTWTALLSTGPQPLMKFGSAGGGVRRLQRALNAAMNRRLQVDGVFSRADHRAVRRYQRRTGRPVTSVVTAATWRDLQAGRLPEKRRHRHGHPHHD
jgi:hypothetical protein